MDGLATKYRVMRHRMFLSYRRQCREGRAVARTTTYIYILYTNCSRKDTKLRHIKTREHEAHCFLWGHSGRILIDHAHPAVVPILEQLRITRCGGGVALILEEHTTELPENVMSSGTSSVAPARFVIAPPARGPSSKFCENTLPSESLFREER